MAQNAVIAICAALWLGVSSERIQAALNTYEPAAMRGEWRPTAENLFYLDCYNANPSSMHDALATFCAVAPAATPRLFVLGGMEELGAEAAAYHRALGRALVLRAGDEVVTIGDHAAELRAGCLERGDSAAAIMIAANTVEIAARIAGFHGAVFVKGSRRYQLERALPTELLSALAHA